MLLALGVRAQGLGGGPREAWPLSARVGDWVTYRLEGGGGRASWWRMAVVGQTRDNLGRDALWIEMEFGQSPELPAPLAAMRLLVARDVGLGAGGVTRLQLAQGVDRPREVSAEALGALWSRLSQPLPPPQPPGGAGPLQVRTGAKARLKVDAGLLTAQPAELLLNGRVIRRIWLCPEVPVLGLVRLEWPGLGQTLEVAAFGHDAKPRLAPPAPQAPQIQLER